MNLRSRIALTLAAALALSGCTATNNDANRVSSSPDGPTPTSIDLPTSAPQVTDDAQRSVVGIDQFHAEYSAAAESLTNSLPDDARIPADPPGQWDEDGQFQEGTGGMQAAFAWQCSWLVEYDRAVTSSDQAATTVALDQLQSWVDLPQVAPNIDDQSRQLWATEFVGAGRAGDPQPLRELARDC